MEMIARRQPDDSPTSPQRYAVLADGVEVGAIVAGALTADAPVWRWSITAIPGIRGSETMGREPTLSAALAAFRAAWERAGVDLAAHREHMAAVEAPAAAWAARGEPEKQKAPAPARAGTGASAGHRLEPRGTNRARPGANGLDAPARASVRDAGECRCGDDGLAQGGRARTVNSAAVAITLSG